MATDSLEAVAPAAPRWKAIDGMVQFAGAGGSCSAALGALLLAKRLAPEWGRRIASHWSKATADVTAGWAQGFHLAQFITFLVCVGIAVAASIAWTLCWRLAVLLTSERVGAWMSAAIALAVVVGAFYSSVRLGLFATTTLIISAWLATESQPDRTRSASVTSPVTSVVVVLAETIAAGWGLWLVLAPMGWSFIIPIVLPSMLVAASYFLGRSGSGARLALATVGGLPWLALPLLGLVRAPSAGWLVLAASASFALATIAPPRWTPHRVPRWLIVPSLLSMTAIAVIPLTMRDVGTLNIASHEAQHLGWVNSALHGRWLGADSGTLYGILREYLLAGYCRLFGATAEHVRVAHVLLNLTGDLVFLVTAYVLFSRRPLLMVSLWYVALFYSPLRNFCDFDLRIALGWADALRMFGATGAVVATSMVLGQDSEAPSVRPRRWLLMGSGALTALAVLYSQEFGLCAVGAVLIAPFAAHVLQPRGRRIALRARATVVSLTWILLGIAAPLAAVLALYACFGKATLLIKTTYKTLSLTASGAFGSIEFPIHVKSFDDPEELFVALLSLNDKMRDATIQLVIPIVIYIVSLCSLAVRWVTKSWSPTSTVLFCLTALGVASYRVALARAGIDHTLSAAGPAILCLGILLNQSVDCCVYLFEEVRFPIGRVLGGALMLVAVVTTERIGGIGHQLEQIAHGAKIPSGKAAHVYRDLPRAGDALVDQDSQDLARFVRETTAPSDKIFTLLYMMDGGELYFLCNRQNATRYDLSAEIMTAEQQHEVLESLQRDPPKLIIGDDGAIVGSDVIAYVKKVWTVPKTIGRFTVWMRPG